MSTAVRVQGNDMAIHEQVALTKLKHLREMVSANQDIQSTGPTPPSQVAFAEAFFYVKVYCNDRGFKLPSGTFARFEGDAYGVAFGGGVTWMTAVFGVPESDIFGDVTFTFSSAGGGTTLSFWRGNRFIGTAVGLGIGVSVGASGGSGKFTQG